MMRPGPTSRLPAAATLLAWLLARLPLWLVVLPWTAWEVWQVRKLGEYGWWARRGALLDWDFMTGTISDPARFNYVHHPYPMVWFQGLLAALGGEALILVATALFGLLSLALVHRVLRAHFDPAPARWATALYALAPACLIFDADPSIIALSALAAPAALALLAGDTPRRGEAVALGAVLLLAGLTNWLALICVPGLWWAARGRPAARGVLVGAALAVGLFLLQLAAYSPDLGRAAHYLRGQAGLVLPGQRVAMALTMATKSVMLAGPALALGAALGLLGWRKGPRRLLVTAALLLAAFLAAGLVLPRFFMLERSMYRFLALPCALLTAQALQQLRSPALRALLVAGALAGTVYTQLETSIPRVSATSRRLADELRAHTQPADVVLSNLRLQQAPFAAWDAGALAFTARLADRRLHFGLNTAEALQREAVRSRDAAGQVWFLRAAGQPLADDAQALLAAAGEPVHRVTLPGEPPQASLALRLRARYWHLLGRTPATGAVQPAELTLYRLPEATP